MVVGRPGLRGLTAQLVVVLASLPASEIVQILCLNMEECIVKEKGMKHRNVCSSRV